MPVLGNLDDSPVSPEEHVTCDMCDRVKALGPEAAAIVQWALRMEGALHRIEEYPGHEEHYPEAEQFTDFRKIAKRALHVPLNEPLWPKSPVEPGDK